MRLDRAFNPIETKWLDGTSYRISNRTKRRIVLKNDKNTLLESIEANSAKTLNGERLQEVDQKLLNELIGANHITVKL